MTFSLSSFNRALYELMIDSIFSFSSSAILFNRYFSLFSFSIADSLTSRSSYSKNTLSFLAEVNSSYSSSVYVAPYFLACSISRFFWLSYFFSFFTFAYRLMISISFSRWTSFICIFILSLCSLLISLISTSFSFLKCSISFSRPLF